MVEPTPSAVTSRASGSAADETRAHERRRDLYVVGAEALLVAAAAIVGSVLTHRGVPIHASAAPLTATWHPHAGLGSLLAVAVVGIVVWRGAEVAHSARWVPLLVAATLASAAWTLGLALVDGPSRGIAGRLATSDEYLHDLPRVHGLHTLLATFSQHILGTSAGHWTTQVAGHPPGALLAFAGLERVGLKGAEAAGLTCVLVGALAPACVAATLRSLGGEHAARAALPYLVLFPGAVWVGTSADGLFMGVVAAGIALVAAGGWWRGICGGVLLGYALYLSYGLALIALLAAAVVALAASRRRERVIAAASGIAVVVAAFTAAGFSWWTGYRLVVERYYAGYGGARPYTYWVWANLACLLVAVGPAAGPALWHALPAAWTTVRRAIPHARLPSRRSSGTWRPNTAPAVLARPWLAAAVLPATAVVVLLVADLSGFSKGETERIWLPFAIWLLPATALLPSSTRRPLLVLQAATALAVNHLLLTHW